MEEFPSNTRREVPGPKNSEPEKKVKKVVEGEVVRRKKPLGKRFKEIFVGQDSRSVGEYVLFDVLIPAAKDMIVDAGQTALERKFYGEIRSGHRRGATRASGRTDYNRMHSRPAFREEPRQNMSRRGRANHNFDEIVIPSRVEAQEVLDNLYYLLEKYESVSVADLYDLVGITGAYTDDKWGWFDLRGAGIARLPSGYLLDLPRPEPIT